MYLCAALRIYKNSCGTAATEMRKDTFLVQLYSIKLEFYRRLPSVLHLLFFLDFSSTIKMPPLQRE
jgi:hypothetical protein